MSSSILVVEADPSTAKILAFLLGDSGYETRVLGDGRCASDVIAEHRVDLLLLGDSSPGGNGRALCGAIRRVYPDLPIIVLSAHGSLRDKVDGFEHGADDYITRPFEPLEVLVRVQAVLRRYRRAERDRYGATIRVGDAALNLGELRFTAPGRQPATLTATEMRVLECLMRNANAVLARTTLMERIWGYDFAVGDNRLDVYIGRLRRKIEEDSTNPSFIQTVRGAGFVFRAGHAATRHENIA